MLDRKTILKYLQEMSEKAGYYRDAYHDNGQTRTRAAAERFEDLRDICAYAYQKMVASEEFTK